jgi:hypothetical protein
LPDEAAPSGDRLRFVSGAWDGILTHLMAAAGEHDEARHIHRALDALRRLIRSGDDPARESLYRTFLDEPVAPYADALVQELARQQDFGPDDLCPHARWLVHASRHREPLKLGIILLGWAGTGEDLADLMTLARHDEFTLFAAVAVGNLQADPTDAWWAMARRVQGWGKVHLVEWLCESVEDRPDIRDWLLRHGCANEVMPEYLAYGCATAGHLLEALSEDEPDDELLDGACLIVQALLNGGPAPGIESYDDGVLAVLSLLGHLEHRCDSLRRLHVVKSILDWVECPSPAPAQDQQEAKGAGGENPDEDDRWSRREELGWTEEVRADLATRCCEILGRPAWRGAVIAAYESKDTEERHFAWVLAPRVGVDLWEAGFARLADDPIDPHLYWNLMQTQDLDRVRRVLAVAEEHLPLDRIATGPANERGLGPEFKAHRCLDYLVQEMRREAVFSVRLVSAALRSPVVRHRNMAVDALEHHPVEDWGPSLAAALERSAREEPDAELRERMERLVAQAG